MKKVIAIIAGILLFATMAQAEDWTFGSGEKTDGSVISTVSGLFYGGIFATDGSSPVTVNIYDIATAVGAETATKLIPQSVITTSAIDRIQAIKTPGPPVHFNKGLYVSPVSAGTFKYVIYYR